MLVDLCCQSDKGVGELWNEIWREFYESCDDYNL